MRSKAIEMAHPVEHSQQHRLGHCINKRLHFSSSPDGLSTDGEGGARRKISRGKRYCSFNEHIQQEQVNDCVLPACHPTLTRPEDVLYGRESLSDSMHGAVLPLTCYLSKKLMVKSLDVFSCDMCDFKTSRLENIVTHNKLNHSSSKTFLRTDEASSAWTNNDQLYLSSDGASVVSSQLKDPFEQLLKNNKTTDRLEPDHNVPALFLSKLVEDATMSDSYSTELPDIISSEPKDYLIEGDLVWAKANRFPYWPAVVKKVYKAKKKIKKVSVLFLKNGSYRKPFSLSGANALKKILPFGSDQEDHEKLVKEACGSQYGEPARELLNEIDKYLLLKHQKKVSCSAMKYFNLTPEKQDRNVENELQNSYTEDCFVENVPDNETLMESFSETSKRLKACLKRRYVRCQLLLDYCGTTALKDYMKSLLSGEVFSYRHQLHSKESLEPEEKSVLKNISFGPIEDEEQQNQLVDILSAQYRSISSMESYQDMKYFTEVVLPECIIHAIQVMFRRSYDKAEDMYNEGFIPTKEERTEEQKLLKSVLTSAERKPKRLSLKF